MPLPNYGVLKQSAQFLNFRQQIRASALKAQPGPRLRAALALTARKAQGKDRRCG